MYKLAIGIGFGLLLFCNEAMAVCSSYPYTLTNGSTADATQVMANFNCAALTSGATLNAVTFTGTNTMQSPSTASDPLVIKNHGGVTGIELREDISSYLKQYFYDHTGATANIFLAGEGSSYFLNTVGIGTSAPSFPFDVEAGSGTTIAQFGSTASGSGIRVAYAGTTEGWIGYAGFGVAFPSPTQSDFGIGARGRVGLDSGGSSYPVVVALSGGSVGIGTATPSYTLHVNGSVAGTSAYNNLSDARLKKNVVPLTAGLALIGQLRPVRFEWRRTSERAVGKDINLPAEKQIGFIAQDLNTVLPEAVSTAKGKDAIMSVAESKIVPVLVAAVKELKAANDNQATEIGLLKGQIVVLQRKVGIQTAQR